MIETTGYVRTRRRLSASAQLLSALHLDGPLLVALGLLAAYGLVILYSASGQSLDTVIRMALRVLLGAAAMLALTHASPHFLRRLAPWLDLGLDIHFYLDLHTSLGPRSSEAIPSRLGAYGYYDDHPLARMAHWPAAEYLADRCAFLAGLVPGVSTFYVDHRLLARSLDDGFNWADALHARGIKLDAWTMDQTNATARANLPRLLQAGVDQITTNTPNAIREVLRE